MRNTRSDRSTLSRPHILIVAVIFFGLTLAAWFAVPSVNAQPAGLANPAHATIIVQFGDHDIAARTISFTAPISGLVALQLTGLNVVTQTFSFGPAVCSIEGIGNPANNCFADPVNFWGYNYWDGSAWQFYSVGAGDSTINDGAIEGWRWGPFGAPMQSAQQVTAALKALEWLRPRQSATDGGYGGDSGTVEAQLAIGADDYLASGWRLQSNSPSILNYQLGYAARYAGQGPAEAGKLAVAQIGAKACSSSITRLPSSYYNSSTGAYFAGAGPQSWAMLGTSAISQTVSTNAVQYLKSLKQSNGGWEFAPGWGTDTNTTALALQALIAAGEPTNSATITQGLAYLRSAQNADGGFPYDPNSGFGTSSDADSTAYVVQAILAAGQDPTSVAWSKGSNNPISFLLSLQLSDGSFEWQIGSGSNQLATEQALVALLGRIFPLRVAPLATCPTTFYPILRR